MSKYADINHDIEVFLRCCYIVKNTNKARAKIISHYALPVILRSWKTPAKEVKYKVLQI